MSKPDTFAYPVPISNIFEGITAEHNGVKHVVRGRCAKGRYKYVSLRRTGKNRIYFTPHSRFDLAQRSHDGIEAETVVEILPF